MNHIVETYLLYLEQSGVITGTVAGAAKRAGRILGPSGRWVLAKYVSREEIPMLQKQILKQKKLLTKYHKERDYRKVQDTIKKIKELQRDLYAKNQVIAHAKAYKDKFIDVVKDVPQAIRKARLAQKLSKRPGAEEKMAKFVLTGKV